MSINLEYFDGKNWISASDSPWHSEQMAWVSLGGDDFNYRTVDASTGEVLTDKSNQLKRVECEGVGDNNGFFEL